MQLLRSVRFGPTGGSRLELLIGDLSEIPDEHAVDILVVSAFPDQFHPSVTSLVGALYAKGLVMRGLAYDKAVDLREHFACWLSKPLGPEFADMNFKRILCFEPHVRGPAPEVVGGVFQALAPFCFGDPEVRSVATPILSTGDEGYAVSAMLPPLLDAAIHWLSIGFPLDVLKIVAQEDQRADAEAIFDAAMAQAGKRTLVERTPGAYDVFVSHAEEDSSSAQHFSESLRAAGARVFSYRSEISIGAAWQQKIFDVLDECKIVAALYSPDFIASKVCKEEFNIAWARQRQAGSEILFPLIVRDVALPTYMKMLNYLDCRTNDQPKLANAARVLQSRLMA
jgi:hypothetical protein